MLSPNFSAIRFFFNDTATTEIYALSLHGALPIACRIVELHDFAAPPEWIAAPLIRQCCDALLMSFKIWNMATVGGNVCMSRSEEHTSELQSRQYLVCRLLLEKKKKTLRWHASTMY